MKIFLSYGHDENEKIILKIKDYLSKDAYGNPKNEVWIDKSEIKAGKDWREEITKGIVQSDVVLAGLSKHSTRIPGVCRDEIRISVGVKGGNIKTILLEPTDEVAAPAMISHIQWLDMSDWKKHKDEGFESEYFQEKFRQIAEMIETPENERFNGEITRLKDALEPISSISRIKSLTQKEMYGRRWLYEKIEEWDKTSNNRLFWIVAGPGFGKSMFAANLQEQYNARIPAIQFVEWGKPDHSNPCRILKNLAFQLAVRYPEYRTFVLQQPDVINKKLNEKNEDELFDLLFCESTWMKIDGGQENVWVLIDALDEANDEYGNKIAQTLARHMDRMPHWMCFILTSRDDSKVMLPLQKYHPQIFDLEEYVKEKNSEDLLLYVRGELEKLHPTEDQVKQIVDKSQGVFLYLSLCVEGIHNGEYSLDHLDKLPDGLNGYYYEFFTRQFGNDIERYKKEIAPVLQLMVAAKKNLQLPFLRYLLGVTETKFFETIAALEHICRITDENESEIITFFHNSVENWLTDRKKTGPFFISREDGLIMFVERFSGWLCSQKKDDEREWDVYPYGLMHLAGLSSVIPDNFNRTKLNTLLNSLRHNPGLGGFSKCHTVTRDSALAYCEMLLNNGKEKEFLDIIIEFFECVKDDYIKIGLVRPDTRRFRIKEDIPFDGAAIFQATLNAGSLAFLIRESCRTYNFQSYETISILLRLVEVIRGYNLWLCSPYEERPPYLFDDLSDLIVAEMDSVIVVLKEKKNHFDLPCSPNEEYSYVGDLYQLALAKRHPEWYSYAFAEIEERKREKEKGKVYTNSVPSVYDSPFKLVRPGRTEMKVRVEAADKTHAKPEDTIFIGNNNVLVVLDWGERESTDESPEALDKRIIDCFNKGNHHSQNKDYQNALASFQEAYWLYKQRGNITPIGEAVLCENIGFLYFMLSDVDKSIDYYLYALDLRVKAQGLNHPDVATTCNNIGRVYYSQGIWPKALEYVSRALTIYKNAFGDDHPYTITAKENVDSIMEKQRVI